MSSIRWLARIGSHRWRRVPGSFIRRSRRTSGFYSQNFLRPSRRNYPFERRRAHEGARAKIPLQIHGQLSLESCCGSLRCSKGGEAAWEEVCSCCVRKLRKLGKNLGELGHPVAAKEHGITESHQVLLNFGHGRGEEVRNRLEACGIIVDSRVRLGTNEVSRRGMKERDMEKIASLIDDGLSNRRPPSKIRKDSFSLMTRHQKVCFTLR